tara:strand:- start:865 stop:1215 length:351 start_codon:yes stop_codon:yes gene_type:complete
LSKYFSKANENKNKEKIEIKTDGIKVNNPKYVIYFLLDFELLLSISFFIALLISKNIKRKRETKSNIFNNNKSCKLLSDSSIKPLSIKVKKVKKPVDNVIIDNINRYMFFLINSDI